MMDPKELDDFCNDACFSYVDKPDVFVIRHNGKIVNMGKHAGRFNQPSHAKLSLNRYIKRQLRFFAYHNGVQDTWQYGEDHYREVIDAHFSRGILVIEKV